MRYKSIRKVVYRSHSRFEPIPAIILQGLFLKQLGFNLKDKIKIEYNHGKIVITKFNH